MDQALEKKFSFFQFYLPNGFSDLQIIDSVKFMIQIIYNSDIVDDSVDIWWFQSFILMKIFLCSCYNILL